MSSALRYPLSARSTRLLLAIVLLLGCFFSVSPQPGPPSPDAAPRQVPALSAMTSADIRAIDTAPPAVEGWVTEKTSSEAVPDAVVSLNGTTETHSDQQGHFAFSAASLPGSHLAEPRSLRVKVSANGHNDWQIDNAVYYPGDTLRVHAKVEPAGLKSSTGFVHPGPRTGSIKASFAGSNLLAPGSPASLAYSVAGAPSAATPPATIRVYRAATGSVEVVPFRDYVKYTLPNEWIPSWGADALKAGAMAVKSYAWYWISVGGKQTALGADVKDNTDDQVYDPNVSYASTDAAVDATFNYAMTINGAFVQAQYCAGSYMADPSGDCPWSDGSYMTQWGSAFYADQGKSWAWILQFYYRGLQISPKPPVPGYDGSPLPPAAPTPTTPPPAPAPPPAGVAGTFAIGQGSDRPELFQDAYARNGGASAIGSPTGPVRWWLTYVTEFNVLAQPLSGPGGRGHTWLVYDILKSSAETGHRAFLLTGDIAATYASHVPAGPEWLGAPTSDPYADQAGTPSQGFMKGMLSGKGQAINYSAWPQQYSMWKAEYFVGHRDPATLPAPAAILTGMPALVRESQTPNFDWPAGAKTQQALGVGSRDWSVQFTRNADLEGGTYRFNLSADSGARLWIDGVLGIDGWQWTTFQGGSYTAALRTGTHTIRIQYFNPGGAARLKFDMSGDAPAAPPQPPAPKPSNDSPAPSLRVSVKWLGREGSPSDSWMQPLTLFLSVPGNPSVVTAYKGVTDKNGVAFYGNLPEGIFDVHVKGPHSLQSARAAIALARGNTTEVDMRDMVEGDVDGDNCVTVDDFSIVQSMLGTDRQTPGFNSAADLNNDGQVSMSDVSLLRSGFDRCGDISADNEFHVLTQGAPTLEQALSPWSSPERLQRNLGLTLVPSTTSASAGDIVAIDVIAQTGTQPIDGVSFVVKYDPARLEPVDAAGNAASGAEPGVSLPSVMGNWIDQKGGAIGYAAGMLQGDEPQGDVDIATIRFRVLPGSAGATPIGFAAAPSGLMQISYGGTNLLGPVTDLSLQVTGK